MKGLGWLLAVVFLPACDLVSAPSDDEGSGGPFQLAILDTESCPLPPGLDPLKVRLLGVKVELRGQAPQGVPANYFYASVLTTDGNRYLAERAGCGPVLSGRPLGPGERAEGYFNFPLPPGKTARTLVYAPLVEGLSEREITREVALDAPRDKPRESAQ